MWASIRDTLTLDWFPSAPRCHSLSALICLLRSGSGPAEERGGRERRQKGEGLLSNFLPVHLDEHQAAEARTEHPTHTFGPVSRSGCAGLRGFALPRLRARYGGASDENGKFSQCISERNRKYQLLPCCPPPPSSLLFLLLYIRIHPPCACFDCFCFWGEVRRVKLLLARAVILDERLRGFDSH